MANPMIEGIKENLKHGFLQAWKNLPVKEKRSIVNSLIEFAAKLDADVRAEEDNG